MVRRVALSGRGRGVSLEDIPYANYFIDLVEFVDFESSDFVIVTHHRKSLMEYYQFFNQNKIYLFLPGESISPDFNLFDYAVGFDPIEFNDRYIQIHPLSFFNRYWNFGNFFGLRSGIESEKRSFCNFIYSNPRSHPFRDEFFFALNKSLSVDSLGNHLNNKDLGIKRKDYSQSNWRQDKIQIQAKYKFSIAFENQRSSGYVTEKLLTSYLAGTIPIYWGAPDVGLCFNDASFVNVCDYNSPEEAIDKVLEINSDEGLFRNILSEPLLLTHQIELFIEKDYQLRRFFQKVFDQRSLSSKLCRPVGTYNDYYRCELARSFSPDSNVLSRFFKRPVERLKSHFLT